MNYIFLIFCEFGILFRKMWHINCFGERMSAPVGNGWQRDTKRMRCAFCKGGAENSPDLLPEECGKPCCGTIMLIVKTALQDAAAKKIDTVLIY